MLGKPKQIEKTAYAWLASIVLIGNMVGNGLLVFATELAGYSEIKEVTLGSYPQSRVTDEKLIEKLNKAAESAEWIYYTDYTGDGENFGTMKPDKLMKYVDVAIAGSDETEWKYEGMYRGVVIEKYRPITTCSISSAGTSFQDDNGYIINDEKSAYWFKYEPITWIVTDENIGALYCDKVIDAKPFNYNMYYDAENDIASIDADFKTVVTDEGESDLFAWMNGDFYQTAFSVAEKRDIETANPSGTYVDIYVATSDEEYERQQEVVDAGLTPYGWVPDSRQATGASDYAKCQGLQIENNGKVLHWLATPGESAGQLKVDDAYGEHSEAASYQTFVGVRPGIRVGSIAEYFDEESIEVKNDAISEKAFSADSSIYNKDIAYMAAELSEAAEAEEPHNIEHLCNGWNIDVGNNFWDRNYGGDLAYAIAYLPTDEYNLVLVTARGSTTLNEFISDYTTGVTENNFFNEYSTYDLVYQFQEEIWNGLDLFLNIHPELEEDEKELKFLITGHSLGGAAANLVGARADILLSRGEWLSDRISTKDIFVYTFGAIDSVSQYNYLINGKSVIKNRCNYDLPIREEKFDNIHNVYNLYDSFAPGSVKPIVFNTAGAVFNIPGGKVFTMYGKFGDVGAEVFTLDFGENELDVKDTTNHNMPTYKYAVKNDLVGKNTLAVHGVVACPVDVTVFDGEKVIGSIKNNEVEAKEDNIILFTADDVKHFFLPEENEYRVEISATDAGKMSYVVEDHSKGSVSYNDIVLESGKAFEAYIGGDSEADHSIFSSIYVIDGKGERTAEVKEDGKEVTLEKEEKEKKEKNPVSVEEPETIMATRMEADKGQGEWMAVILLGIVGAFAIGVVIWRKNKGKKEIR